jgi:lysophospholipase L1-like esterase
MKSLIVILFLCGVLDGYSQAVYDTVPNLPEHYVQRLEKFRKEPVVRNWKRLLKDSTVINRGISGDNTYGLLRRLDEITARKPSSIFLLIGVNDLSKDIPNAAIIENIFTIVSKIRAASPSTKIYVQSLLPVNPSIKDFPSQFSKQEHILEINGQLKKYSEVLKFTFVDIHGYFLDPQNLLDVKYTHDGLHLNAAGYTHWVAFLKKNKYL